MDLSPDQPDTTGQHCCRRQGLTQPEQARRRHARSIANKSGMAYLVLLMFVPGTLLARIPSITLFSAPPGHFMLAPVLMTAAVLLAGVGTWEAVARYQQHRAAALSRALEDLAAVLPTDAQPIGEALAVKVAGLDARAARRACIPMQAILADLDARGDLDAAARQAGQRLDDLCSTR